MKMKVKDKYTSYQLFNDDIEKYKKENHVNFTLKNTKKLENCWINRKKRNLIEEGYNKDLIYYQAALHCSNAKQYECNACITISAVDKNHLEIKKIIDQHSESCTTAKVIDNIDAVSDDNDDDIDHILQQIKKKIKASCGHDRKDKMKDCNNLIDTWETNVHCNPPGTTEKPEYVSDGNKKGFATSIEKPSEALFHLENTTDSPRKETTECNELSESSTDDQISTSTKLTDSPYEETEDCNESSSDEQVSSTSTKMTDSPYKETEDCNKSSSDEQVSSTSTKMTDSPYKETEKCNESSSDKEVSSTLIKIVKFEELSDNNKVRKMLKWLQVPESLLEAVLMKTYILRNNKFSNVRDSFRDKSVVKSAKTLLVHYLDEVSFETFRKKLDAMARLKTWTCICKKSIKTRSIQCDSCKLWFHYKCAGISEAPDNNWYCQECVSSAT